MKMKSKKSLIVPVLLAALLLMAGCYPDKIDYVDEYDVAATIYDEQEDFSALTTFHVVDTVMHYTDDGEDDPNFSRDHDAFIIDLVRQNMLDLGWTEEPDEEAVADATILIGAISSDYYQYWGYWWDYWYWYPGWGYPGYPWYPSYPWYPGYVTSYSTGTLSIEMGVDFDAEPEVDPLVREEEEARMVWMGLVDGLLAGSSSSAKPRLEKQINQLFIQSEYLQK
jgi:hypothetical protein